METTEQGEQAVDHLDGKQIGPVIITVTLWRRVARELELMALHEWVGVLVLGGLLLFIVLDRIDFKGKR